DVLGSFSPAQQVLAIVNEELIEMLGGADGKNKLDLSGTPPNVIMLVGLQGSGKTTTAAKLANYLRKQGQRPITVAADMYRPAAVRQLQTLGKQLSIPVYAGPMGANPVDICGHSVGDARGGAALSIRSVTGVPIKFMGVGEKTDALEPFYPDRLASPILGMGDVISLIEKAQETIDQEEALKAQAKLQQGKFDLEDFL